MDATDPESTQLLQGPVTHRRHYSKDLRERVIYLHSSLGKTPSEISVLLNMSLRVVQQTLQIYNEVGDVVRDPKTYMKRGRPNLLNEVACSFMSKLLECNPDIYLDEIALELSDTLGLETSLTTIHNTLEMLGYTTKKLSKVALERCETSRRHFLFTIGDETADRLVFVDESAVNVHTSYRRMGRALKGQRATKHTRFQRGERYSVLPAITIDGIIHLHMKRGSFDGDSFRCFVSDLLDVMNPYPGPRSVLVMDNCAIHHVEGIDDLCEERGVKLLYLPPYSPDFNPIEECFSYMKKVISRHSDAFRAALDSKDEAAVKAFISDTLATVTPEHAQAWFKHSNYL